MKRTIFAVSDVHGHYTELMQALEDAGFDAEREDHLFVSCGDLFDRGTENARVYAFVRGLKEKILIRGNHEDNLYRILQQGVLEGMDRDNETDKTIAELIGPNALDERGCLDVDANAAVIREILDFLASMTDYYETATHVFTHGWLPVTFEGNRPRISSDWRNATEDEWLFAHTLEWQQLYSVGAVPADKTLVCGHRPARIGYWFDDTRVSDCSETFYGNRMIAIDAGTILSGRVNVLIVEE